MGFTVLQFMFSFLNLNKKQKIWDFETIKNGIVYMNNGKKKLVLEVFPINFSLLESEEKLNKIAVFERILRKFDAGEKVQVLIQTRSLDLGSYYELLRRTYNIKNELLVPFKEYENFVRQTTIDKELVTKRFYIIIESNYDNSDLTEITEKANRIMHELSGASINAHILNTDGVIELLVSSLNEGKYLENKSIYSGFDSGGDVPKDPYTLIQPDSIKEDLNNNCIIVDNKYFLRSLYVSDFPDHASEGWLTVFIDSQIPCDIVLTYQINDNFDRLKKLKDKRNQVEASIFNRDSNSLSSNVSDELVLEQIKSEEEDLLKGLSVPVNITIEFLVRGTNVKDLNIFSDRVVSNGRSRGFILRNYYEEQIAGFKKCLIVCNAKTEVKSERDLNSKISAFTFPFSQSVINNRTGILYGVNPEKRMIFIDRQNLSSYHKSIIAYTGAGKSYYTTTDIFRSHIIGYQQFIIDPEGEYEPLVEYLGGRYIATGNNSKDYINPFYISDFDEDKEYFGLYIGYTLGLIKHLLKTYELTEYQLTKIREKVQNLYLESYEKKQEILLKDIVNEIKGIDELSEVITILSQYLDTANPMYFLFNNKQSIDFSNDNIVAFYLGKAEDKSLLASIILQQFWNNLINSKNRKRFKTIIIDEARTLFTNPVLVNQLKDIALRGRKYNAGLTTIVQEISHYYDNHADDILDQSAITLVMRQKEGKPLDNLCDKLKLNETEKKYLSSVSKGSGLLMIDSIKDDRNNDDVSKIHRNIRMQIDVIASQKEVELHNKGKKVML